MIYSPQQTRKRFNVLITAYSSTPDQTDSTPFLTAAGNTVKDGIIAANFLPFGTKVRIPELFNTKIFVVDDRMHPKNDKNIDIWFPTREEAIMFGKKWTYIEIVN
ncbi:3D domain-containing protein [Candidatus Parcubacteria bacterium]|nr:3D domain-containing protein [Candidatus Parcubacteria bacterium]